MAITAIADGGRNRAIVLHEFADQIVQMLGCHAGFDFRDEHVEAFGDQTARAAHPLEAFGVVDADFARAHGQEEVCVVHCPNMAGQTAVFHT